MKAPTLLRRFATLRRPSLLRRAPGTTPGTGPVAYWDTRYATDVGILHDKTSNRHHLQYGSTPVAAITPAPHATAGLRLPGTSGRYAFTPNNTSTTQPGGLSLPGTSGSYASTPDAVDLDITGDIDMICRVALTDWTPAGSQSLIAKRLSTGEISYQLRVSTTGALVIVSSSNGTTGSSATSSVIMPSVDGSTWWVRVTRRQSDGLVQFFYAAGSGVVPTVWTQLGTDQTLLAATAMWSGTAALEIGTQNVGANDITTGKIYRAIVKSGINGTTVFDADFTSVAQGWTVGETGGGGSGVDATGKVVTLFGTAIIVAAPNINVTGDIDIQARVAPDLWTADQTVVAKSNAGSDRSWILQAGVGGLMYLTVSTDGSTTFFAASTVVVPGTNGEALWIRATRNATTGDITFYTASDSITAPTTWTQLGAVVNRATGAIFASAQSLTIGAYNVTPTVSSNPFAGYIYRVIVKNGIAGTTVFDADFATQALNVPRFAESSMHSAPVTVNPFNSGRIVNGAFWANFVNGNYAIPSTLWTGLGDAEFVTRVRLGSSSTTAYPFGNFSGSVNGSWGVFFDTTIGVITRSGGANSVGNFINRSSLTGGGLEGAIYWFKFTRVSSTGTWSLQWQVDTGSNTPPTSGWSTAGVTPQTLHTGTLASTTTPNVGNGGNPYNGSVHYWSYAASSGGVPVFTFDPSVLADGTRSWTGPQGNQWTLVTSTVDGSDTNDPLFLPFSGRKYVRFPGVTGNNITTPFPPNLQGLTTLDIVARVAPSIWGGDGVNRTIVSAYSGTASSTAFLFQKTSGGLLCYISHSGGTVIGAHNNGTAIPNTSAGQSAWLRVTRTAAGVVTFYYSTEQVTDPAQVTWVQLGATVAGGTGSSGSSVTQPIQIGGWSGSGADPWDGDIHYVEVRDTIGGTPVALFDASQVDQTGYASSTSAWTINRSASGRKTVVVDRPLMLFGTDDYLEAPDHADLDFTDNQPFTALVVFRAHGMSGMAFKPLIAKKASGGAPAGWYLYVNSGSFDIEVGDGTDSVAMTTGTALANATVNILALTGTSAGVLQRVVNGADYGASNAAALVDSMANALAFRVGAFSSSVPGTDIEFLGAAVFRRVLTTAEITQVGREFSNFEPKSLIEESVLAATAANATSDILKDLSGKGNHLRFGSATGSDTNDPKRLVFAGEKYSYLPGLTSNFLTTPDSNALDVTDLDVRVRVAADDWSNGTQTLAAKWGGGATGLSWLFQLQSSGTPIVYWSNNGATTTASQTCSAAVPFSDNQTGWVRCTFDVNNGASGYTIKFWTSFAVSPGTDDWTQLGTTITGGATTTIFGGNASLSLGGRTNDASADLLTGKFYRGMVMATIDGTAVADFDTSLAVEPYTTTLGRAGETWTFGRSTLGRKLAVVDQTLLLFGSDDYLETADNDLLDVAFADDFTVLALYRRYGFTTNTIIAKKPAEASGTGWMLYDDGTNLAARYNNGTTEYVSFGALTTGRYTSVALVKSGSSLRSYQNGVALGSAVTVTGSSVNSEVLRVGRLSGAGTNYLNGEIIGIAVIRRALTVTEMQQLEAELLAANAIVTT